MTKKTVEECNAYSLGWNDKEAGARRDPPHQPELKKMYDLGFNDANDANSSTEG